MDPRKLYFDDRFDGMCIYCGEPADSKDHVPSKVFLDKPYPKNLPVVRSCSECNGDFSGDEEYLACFLECVFHGTTEPNDNFREKIFKTLSSRKKIASRIENAKILDSSGNLNWQPEIWRIKAVVEKLARGHIFYELGINHFGDPSKIEITPVPIMNENELEAFCTPGGEEPPLLPEVGSRSFVNYFAGKPTAFHDWEIVQEGRYAYRIGQIHGEWVKIILRDYLACLVVWE